MIDIPPFQKDAGFAVPKAYHRVLALGLTNLEPWRFLSGASDFAQHYDMVRQLYPDKQYIPFARREDNDDIACFLGANSGTIAVVHAFASPGYQVGSGIYTTFWDWFRLAIDEMIAASRDIGTM